MRLSALLILTVLLCSCACRNGRRYPIIGLGWVTLSTNQPTVVSTTAFGLNTGSGQLTLGLSSFTTVTVATNANVIIDLRK